MRLLLCFILGLPPPTHIFVIKVFPICMIELLYYIIPVLAHGRIYFGTTPFLLIADLDMIRDVTVKQFDKFVDRTVSLLFVSIHSK